MTQNKRLWWDDLFFKSYLEDDLFGSPMFVQDGFIRGNPKTTLPQRGDPRNIILHKRRGDATVVEQPDSPSPRKPEPLTMTVVVSPDGIPESCYTLHISSRSVQQYIVESYPSAGASYSKVQSHLHCLLLHND